MYFLSLVLEWIRLFIILLGRLIFSNIYLLILKFLELRKFLSRIVNQFLLKLKNNIEQKNIN